MPGLIKAEIARGKVEKPLVGASGVEAVGKGQAEAERYGHVIGGLFTPTLLRLVVVPVVYSLIEGGRARVSRWRGSGYEDDERGAARLRREPIAEA